MRRAVTLIELLVVLVLLGLFGGVAGIWCWSYSINTWLGWAGKEASISGWEGFLLGLIPGVGYVSPFVAIFTWVADKFMRPYEIHSRWYATGTGGPFAWAVLMAGCGIEKAMETALKMDPNSGFGFDLEYLE